MVQYGQAAGLSETLTSCSKVDSAMGYSAFQEPLRCMKDFNCDLFVWRQGAGGRAVATTPAATWSHQRWQKEGSREDMETAPSQAPSG